MGKVSSPFGDFKWTTKMARDSFISLDSAFLRKQSIALLRESIAYLNESKPKVNPLG